MCKIFVDAHVFDGEFQGTLTYIKELYIKVLELNPKVTLYFGAKNIENVKKYFKHFTNVNYITYASKGSFRRIFIEIPKIIDEFEFTHAHFQYTIPLKKNKNCKYIVTIHDILFNDFSKEFSWSYRMRRNILFYLSAKRSDYLLTVSKYSKQKIAEHYSIKAGEIIITPNAVSDDYFQFNVSKVQSRKYIGANYGIKKFILYVSRIEPRKNQTLLLRVFTEEKLWKKGYALVFIGSNSLESGLFEMINALDQEIKKVVYWIEQVNEIELKHFLNAAELFAYPSKAEGFGIPPLEAAALFTPVLCSKATAMSDFDFFEPFFFDPENYNEIQKLMLDLIVNEANLDVVSIQAIIKNKYSWAKSARILMEEVIYDR